MKNMNESAIDKIQVGLDAVGLVPGIGEFADGLNGIISLGRGDFTGAGLSFVSMIPGIGDAIGKGGKVARAAAKSPKIAKLVKGGKKAAKAAAKSDPKTMEKISKAASKMKDAKNAIVKKSGEVKKLHKAVLDGDLKSIEKMYGKEIPAEHRKVVQAALDAAGKKLSKVDMKKDVLNKIEAIAKAGDQVDSAEDGSDAVQESLRYDLFYRSTLQSHVDLIWEDLGNTLNEQALMYKNK